MDIEVYLLVWNYERILIFEGILFQTLKGHELIRNLIFERMLFHKLEGLCS